MEKGALAVYEEDEDALATIHYSSYKYDKNQIDIEYLKWFLKSRTFQNIVKEQAGGGIKTELKAKKFLPLKIKLPGLDEQIDIARKIDNVAAEIDDLSETNNHNQTLLIQLRQAILQEAVQGKLIPQDPNDEPASELLKRIKAEKGKLIIEGKIKKTKPLPPITENEIPYELPQGWEWVRLGELAVNIHYGFTASANNSVYDVRLLRITDIQNNKVNWNTVPGCEIHDTEIVKYALKDNDILIARTGGTIGKSFIVKKIPVKAVFASYLIRVIPWEILDADYMKLFLESPMYWTQLFEKSMGTGQPNVNASSLKQLKITLPPLTEQKRIVSKVDQLMHLCNELETQLNQSKNDSEMLLQAVLQEAFGS